MASRDGYRMPPDWVDDAAMGVRSPRRRVEQVQVMFPVGPGIAIEFQWVFHDGTTSPWQAATQDLRKAPPGARGLSWRAADADKPAKAPV